MAKPKKKPRGKKKSSQRAAQGMPPEPLPHDDTVSEARAQAEPLRSLPPSFLEMPLPKPPSGDAAAAKPDRSTPTVDEKSTAVVRYFSSPLPAGFLRQCLNLFETNMGEMYRQSQWGLNMKEKRRELQHADARFLLLLASPAATTTSTMVDGSTTERTEAAQSFESKATDDRDAVLGFAHLRYERDDDGILPVSYLYELQVRPDVQKLGLGKKLMILVELLSLQLKMKKVMLTVFHNNVGATRFYRKRGYAVDASSPSHSGEEDEGCDYEILSKSFG